MLNLRLLIIDNMLSFYVLQWTKQQKCHGGCWGTDWCDSGVCFTVIYFTVSYLCILRKFPHLLFYATAAVSVYQCRE